MSSAIRRQLERIKADLDKIKPIPSTPVRLVARPGPEATDAQREAFAEAIAWSKAQGGNQVNLIILSPLKPVREVSNNVMTVGNEVEAQLTFLALQASECGKASRLNDVLDNLSGNVIGAGGVARLGG